MLSTQELKIKIEFCERIHAHILASDLSNFLSILEDNNGTWKNNGWTLENWIEHEHKWHKENIRQHKARIKSNHGKEHLQNAENLYNEFKHAVKLLYQEV
jgi:hypothetical protein